MLDDAVGAGRLLCRARRMAQEDLRPHGRIAHARDSERAADLEGMHQLHALLAALRSVNAYALVALGEVPMHEGDSNAVLPLRGVKADVAQAAVDLVHRYLLLLIDGLL